MKEAKAEIKSINVYCQTLGKEVKIDISNAYWTSGESECEMCGSHGGIEVEFKCECGKNHMVIIKEW